MSSVRGVNTTMIKMTRWTALAAALVLGPSVAAQAKVDVVAATQDLAWVARAVGGAEVSAEYLAASNQDPHTVDPRPSQVAKLARARLVVRVGMDLDLWFDSLLRAAGNSAILPGGKGYVDASRGVRVLEIPSGKLDPSKGDIHVHGNPHYLYGPSNLPVVAASVRDGLKRVDPTHAADYDANYAALKNRLDQALPRWKARLSGDRGKLVVTYHKSLVYFLDEFGLKEAGNVEPRPGVEPTVGHVASLGRDMKAGGVRVILAEAFRSRRWTDLLAGQSGATAVMLPSGIGAEKGIDDYFALIDAWVERTAAAL